MSFRWYQRTKTRLFIFISVIISPQNLALFSILAPLSPQAECSPFTTIWQGAPSTAERFGKLLCGGTQLHLRKPSCFGFEEVTYYLCLSWNFINGPLGELSLKDSLTRSLQFVFKGTSKLPTKSDGFNL